MNDLPWPNFIKSVPAGDLICPMTHLLSQHWEQPGLGDFTVDSEYAYMDLDDFWKLPDYSTSEPSGVYEGKMWRSSVYIDDDKERTWILRWFGLSDKPDTVILDWRRIVIFYDFPSISLSFQKSR